MRQVIGCRGSSIYGEGRPTSIGRHEVNVRRLLTDRVTADVGYRHVDLEERFQVVITDGTTTSEAGLAAFNRMDGIQLGCHGVWWRW